MRCLNERKKGRTVRKIIRVILILFVLALVILGFAGYRYISNGLAPVDATSEEVVEVEIPTGSSRGDIANILEENGVIDNSFVFEQYMRFRGGNDYQAGNYSMSPSMSVEEIVGYLNEGGTPITEQAIGQLTIPEGVHIEQIAERLEENTEFSEDDFMSLIQDPAFIEEMSEEFPDLLTSAVAASEETRYVLEGYLFPATYEVFEDTTLEGLVTQTISRMHQAVAPYYADISAGDLSVHEILTLASYIEREGTSDEDRQLISGVFYNRIDEGMPMQTDPSVAYALGEHRERTSYEDLEVDSPYNTYMYAGIGPGPVNSPSESAIQAAVHPEESDYLYFLADLDTGEIYYSETYDQHIEYQNEYLRNND